MASFDLNKPVSGAWNSPNVIRTSAGKTVTEPPKATKMATERMASTETKSSLNSEKTSGVASGIDVPVLNSNFALEFSLLLSMYGAGNLPLQLANSPTGSIPPFGLFPFGLAVPPLPISPLPQGAEPVITPPSRSQPKQKVPSKSNKATKSCNLPKQTLISSKQTQHFVSKTVPKTQKYTPVGLDSAQNTRNLPPALLLTGSSCLASKQPQKGVVLTPVGETDLRNAMSTPGCSKSTRNMSAHIPRAPPPSSILKAVQGKPGPAVGVQRFIHQNEPYAGARTRPVTTARSLTLQSPCAAGLYGGKTINPQRDPNFRDAEVAAILLGLRHGLGSESGANANVVAQKVAQSVRMTETQRQIAGRRQRSESVEPAPTAIAQAVDLSTKTKSKPHNVLGLNPTTQQSKITKSSNLMVTERQKQSLPSSQIKNSHQNLKPPSDRARSDRKQVHADPRMRDPAAKGTRHFLTPAQAMVDSTSVVSHLPSCICAFDCPSHLEGGNASPEKTNQGHHIAGFKFKKVICEKFSQSADEHLCKNKTCQRTGGPPSGAASYTVRDSISRDSIVPPWNSNSVMEATSALCDQGGSHSTSQSGLTHGKRTLLHSLSEQEKPSQNSKTQRNKMVIEPRENAQMEHFKGSENPSSCVATPSTILNTFASSPYAGGAKQGLKPSEPLHSFSELRQKSGGFRNLSDSGRISSSSPQMGSQLPDGGRSGKPTLPVTNLYRIRNSALGGSNDSLHSVRSDKEVEKANSGDESDSSCSSSDSDCSGGANSDESDADSEGLDSASFSKSDVTQATSSPTRSKFVLSRPKFTLSSSEATSNVLSTSRGHSTSLPGGAAEPGSSNVNASSKIKIRRPTFTFSSAGIKGAPQGEKIPDPSGDDQTKIPELKRDEDEGEHSFKMKLIRALANPGSKEGLAVNGKSLRALLGEATCFYHNNRKYVLKRCLTKCKPKEDLVADVSGTNGMLASARNVSKDVNNNTYSERANQHRIEPRISVTATVRTEEPKKSEEKLKKLKKMKRRESKGKRRMKFQGNFRGKRANSENITPGNYTVPHNKRRRRNHEIENLVFEGAGGLTPIPDLSLRDSDVFSNIKLRRREAAKRGIAGTHSVKTEKTEKSILRTKWIKTAAHNRAIANKHRKNSIEKKLRKYQKRNRMFLVKKAQAEVEKIQPRTSCVRINAGVARPHLDVQAFAAEEVRKFRRDATAGQSGGFESRRVCIVTAHGKQGPRAEKEVKTDRHGVVSDADGKPCERESVEKRKVEGTDGEEANTKQEETSENTPGKLPLENSRESDTQRRTSKRIFQRKMSSDRAADRLKIGDDVTTNCDSDSVRSDSPSMTSSNVRKRRSTSSKGRVSPHSTKSNSGKGERNSVTSSGSRGSRFHLLSCFPAPSAITLTAAFGDLQPSYSMKGLSKLGSQSNWDIGACAVETKQQLQREFWRNMTLDMFTNGNGYVVNDASR